MTFERGEWWTRARCSERTAVAACSNYCGAVRHERPVSAHAACDVGIGNPVNRWRASNCSWARSGSGAALRVAGCRCRRTNGARSGWLTTGRTPGVKQFVELNVWWTFFGYPLLLFSLL